MGNRSTDCAMSQWENTVKERIAAAASAAEDTALTSPNRCIHKVPGFLVDGQRNGHTPFTPDLVSLGPYHHDAQHLQPMEPHKWRVLHCVLTRLNHDISTYIHAIMNLEPRARTCYEGVLPMDPKDFALMLVLDGCFILDVFGCLKRKCVNLGYPHNDVIFNRESIMHGILRDMIKLENQIPFFILEKLYELQYGSNDASAAQEVISLALKFLNSMWVTSKSLTKEELKSLRLSISHEGGLLHCLDILRRSLLHPRMILHPEKNVHPDIDQEIMLYSVTELKEAGVRFKKPSTTRSFWDVRFNRNGVLEINPIRRDEGFRSMFLNLIAFEQRHLTNPTAAIITPYIAFMDNLVNTAADVAHLHYVGVVVHQLGGDADVADLFNRMRKGVFFNMQWSYHRRLYAEMNKYCQIRENRWWATLRQNYFNNPWASISVADAIFLLILTSIQTFFSVYSYFKHPK